MPMIDENDDNSFETIIGHDGRPARIVRDKRGIRVPLRLMDQALSPSVRAAMRDSTTPLHDGRGNKPGHKPGFVISDAAQNDAKKQRAYAEYEKSLISAYRRDAGEGDWGEEGDQCTIRSGGGEYGPEGSDGTLQMIDGELVCCALGYGTQDKKQTVADAYSAYDKEIASRWRQG